MKGITRRTDIEQRAAGLTEAERTEAKLEEPPEFVIPIDGLYLWQWFSEINDCVDRIKDGVCYRLPPSEWLAWRDLNDYLVTSDELQILLEMDKQFCTETNKELAANRERETERIKREAERKAKH